MCNKNSECEPSALHSSAGVVNNTLYITLTKGVGRLSDFRRPSILQLSSYVNTKIAEVDSDDDNKSVENIPLNTKWLTITEVDGDGDKIVESALIKTQKTIVTENNDRKIVNNGRKNSGPSSFMSGGARAERLKYPRPSLPAIGLFRSR